MRAGEPDLRAGRSRSTKIMRRKRQRLAGLDGAALLVEPDREQRADHHEAGQRREQDVVEAEREQPPDDGERDREHRKAVGEARAGLDEQIAPAGRSQPKAAAARQVARGCARVGPAARRVRTSAVIIVRLSSAGGLAARTCRSRLPCSVHVRHAVGLRPERRHRPDARWRSDEDRDAQPRRSPTPATRQLSRMLGPSARTVALIAAVPKLWT